MNNNVLDMEISGIRSFAEKAEKVKGSISLSIGQPDFHIPSSCAKAMIKSIEDNITGYSKTDGEKETKIVISEYLKSLGINYSPYEICMTIGASEAMYAIFSTLMKKGDKILIPSPSYPAYEGIAKILDLEVVNCRLNDDFSLNIDELRKKITEQDIKNLIICFPCNPTGAVLSRETRDELVQLIKDTDIMVITDEVYSSIIFDDYYSLAQVKDIRDNIVYINGFSKMLSMTGFRIGYFACTEKIMNSIIKVHQYMVSCASTIAQFGVTAGLKEALDEVDNMKNIFMKRRNYCMRRLGNMNIDVVEPKGAFYIFPEIKKFNMSSLEFCNRLLEEEKLACVPGSSFGEYGEGYIRISYCYCDEELKEAFDRLEKFCVKMTASINN